MYWLMYVSKHAYTAVTNNPAESALQMNRSRWLRANSIWHPILRINGIGAPRDSRLLPFQAATWCNLSTIVFQTRRLAMEKNSHLNYDIYIYVYIYISMVSSMEINLYSITRLTSWSFLLVVGTTSKNTIQWAKFSATET